MEERLEWIRLAPTAWADWEPVRGGLQGHALVAQRYASAEAFLFEPAARRREVALKALARPWWRRLGRPRVHTGLIPDASVQMLWANMQLHMAADPMALMAQWHRALAVDGFLMFSCLGPDTLQELRALYRRLGWPPPSHEFTDMHDWGDMLVASGFAEPVMDMERLTLTFESPARLLQELRELGANLNPERFGALRGREWLKRLHSELDQCLRGPDGRLALTFEVIYGHALKPLPRLRAKEESAISVTDLRAMLHGSGPRPK